jgi:hypothetical protein
MHDAALRYLRRKTGRAQHKKYLQAAAIPSSCAASDRPVSAFPVTDARDRQQPCWRNTPLWWCALLLLGALALQPPQSVAVEEELRAPGWSMAEVDGPEPAPDDFSPGALTGLTDSCADLDTRSACPIGGSTHFARHPALTALNPRAPPAR